MLPNVKIRLTFPAELRNVLNSFFYAWRSVTWGWEAARITNMAELQHNGLICLLNEKKSSSTNPSALKIHCLFTHGHKFMAKEIWKHTTPNAHVFYF